MHAARRSIKSLVAASVIFLFLAVPAPRANAHSTKPGSPSVKGITEILPQSFIGSTSLAHSIAVWLDGELLSLWSDGDEKDKKNNDKDDRVPEPGVILQLTLGLLGVIGLRSFLKPQESNPR